MSDVVKVSWSGGKDSTCAVMLHIERGDKVKAERPDNFPLRNHEWFIDTDQVTFFDKE